VRLVAIMTALLAATASFFAVQLIRGTGSAPSHSAASTTAKVSPQHQAAPTATPAKAKLGIISYNLPVFEQQTKIFPAITAKYYDWGTPFPTADVLANHSEGVETLIVLEPQKQSAQSIIAGKHDAYLAQFAAADKKLGLPIILSFAPEANGDWYPWGFGHIKPATYQKMYQHVHNVLIRDGAKKVTWLWQVDRIWHTTEPLNLLWPGKSYVNMIGFDGQLTKLTATLYSLFGPTIKQVRSFTKTTPLMLSEVAIEKSPSRPQRVTALFAAANKEKLRAVVFFDVGIWDFDTDKATLAAIRKAAAPHK
jgi:mannan endo-1,4-beta-mannosidase